MKLLLTLEEGYTRDVYMPADCLDALRGFGALEINQDGHRWSSDELAERIADADICVTHWGAPPFNETVLARADKLKLIAHCAGSVASIATPASYERGIRVLSANPILAQHVAEAVLGHLIMGLRFTLEYRDDMRGGIHWESNRHHALSLYEATIGLVGLGAIGRNLLEHLRPFAPDVRIYDPFIAPDALAPYPFARLCALDEVLSASDAVSLHASLTEDSWHMIGARELSLIRDGALFINTARGAVCDEDALIAELSKNRFRAILDVFEREPPPMDSPLRAMPNVVLQPHTAGTSARAVMTRGIIADIARFLRGEQPHMEVSREQHARMTNEALTHRRG